MAVETNFWISYLEYVFISTVDSDFCTVEIVEFDFCVVEIVESDFCAAESNFLLRFHMTTFNDDQHPSMSPFSLLLRLPRFLLLYICKLLITHHLFDTLFLYYRNGKDTWEKTKRPSPPVVEYIISRLNIFPGWSTQVSCISIFFCFLKTKPV